MSAAVPRFNLKRPCRHCPFRTDETAIRFRCRERAEEIEESAYRYGFPCHESADLIEHDDIDYGQDGYVFGQNTQHCVGFIIMQLKSGSGSPWPGIGNDEDLYNRLCGQVDWSAPVFEDTDAFLEANEGER